MTFAPKWGPQGREVFERTYSRLKADGTNETWADMVYRVVDGNLALVPAGNIMVGERAALLDLIGNMKALPAGRHLWTSGVAGRQFNRNCHRAGWTARLSDHFGFMFDELMKGGGVGANYSEEYLALAKPISTMLDLRIACDPAHPDVVEVNPDQGSNTFDHVRLHVSDSREGWVKAVTFLIDLATALPDPRLLIVTVDVSDVRPRGAALRGFGGTASGPGPLVDALRMLVKLLNKAHGRKLTGMEAMSIDHGLAQCVVAGNVRRSARMSVMHWEDSDIFDFINCKADATDHWTTNISVEIDDAFFLALERQELLATTVFQAVVDAMATNGEPGFFNSSLASVGENADVRCTNPCGEIALNEWESCNLGHVNLAAFHGMSAELRHAFVLMARFLVRATFAELLNPLQASVEDANRRIGVGIMGFQEWLGSHGMRYSDSANSTMIAAHLLDMKIVVVRASDAYADELGIPRPIKHTTVAPTGTVAKLAGVTEGIHPIYSRYFVRRMRYANGDANLGHLIEQGYETEPCVYNPNTTVVLFHVRDPLLDTMPEVRVQQADELTVAEKLAVQRLVQTFFADNAVSYTVNMAADTSTEELEAALRKYLPDLKGTTVFPANTRPQSPYTAISREEYLAAVDHGVDQSFDECSTGACPIR
jgi:ribonucleoside-triphosphate reductase